MKSLESVRTLGLYSSACCKEEIIFNMNESFFHCPECESSCRWDLVEQVVSWQEMDDFDHELQAA
jgi:hypothetical protein